jgi:hypothetical protein
VHEDGKVSSSHKWEAPAVRHGADSPFLEPSTPRKQKSSLVQNHGDVSSVCSRALASSGTNTGVLRCNLQQGSQTPPQPPGPRRETHLPAENIHSHVAVRIADQVVTILRLSRCVPAQSAPNTDRNEVDWTSGVGRLPRTLFSICVDGKLLSKQLGIGRPRIGADISGRWKLLTFRGPCVSFQCRGRHGGVEVTHVGNPLADSLEGSRTSATLGDLPNPPRRSRAGCGSTLF